MRHPSVKLVTLSLLLCQAVCAGYATASRLRSDIVALASPHIREALGQEFVKLALLGFIFVAVRRLVRHIPPGSAPTQPRPSISTFALDVLTQKWRTNNSLFAETCKPGVTTKRSDTSAVIEEDKNGNSTKMELNPVARDAAYPSRNDSGAAVRQQSES